MHGIKGIGSETNDKSKRFHIEGEIEELQTTQWNGWWLGKTGSPVNMALEDFKIDSSTGVMSSSGNDELGPFTIIGSMDFQSEVSNENGEISFSFERTEKGKTTYHKGKINK